VTLAAMKITKHILRVLWVIVIVCAIGLYWWMAHGSWQDVEGDMVLRDAVRFGPIPIFLGIAWFSLFVITSVAHRIYASSAQHNKGTQLTTHWTVRRTAAR